MNELNKAVELSPSCSELGRESRHGAHMRAFCSSTISFFLAFVGWVALAPVAVDVAHPISICKIQVSAPLGYPKRKASLK